MARTSLSANAPMVSAERLGLREVFAGSFPLPTSKRRPELFGKQVKSLPSLLGDLKDLTISYAKQETFTPLKGLVRYIIFGVAGSVVLGIGLVLWALAVLRVLQEETGSVFATTFSWAPYLITLVVCAAVMAVAVSAIFSDKRKAKRRQAERKLTTAEKQAVENPAPGSFN